ncbi:MAG: hypothetical protein IK107_01345 [Oscillospiraceae bacterium]|nr:hypothetical protein [Oscillospiraceae bacterium]
MSKNLFFQSFKCFVCGMLIGCIGAGSVLSVHAWSQTQGQYSVMSPPDTTYYAHNTLVTGKLNGSKFARAFTHVDAPSNMPGGFMGVLPMLFDGNDNLLKQASDWALNESNRMNASAMIKYTGFSGSPEVYSQGLAKVWHPYLSTYWVYGTFRTPSLSDYTEQT